MNEFDKQIEADIDRASTLMRNLAKRCYEMAKERGQENFRFDAIGVVGVVAWTDDNGDENEDTIAVFESRKHHVQTGILVDLLVGRMY